jgi:hypothetical protein
MKRNRVLLLVAVLALGVTLAAGAAGMTLQVGATAYDFNALSANQKATNPQPITSTPDISPDPFINGFYGLALDKDTRLNLGLMAEDMMGIDSPAFIQVGRIEPYADLSIGGLSARMSFPMYLLGYDTTNDPANALITYVLDKYYKGINLATFYKSGSTYETFELTNYESVGYRLNLDKTTAFVFSASTEITFSPTFWLNDLKPQVTFIYGPVQLDVRESIYFANSNQNPSMSDVKYNLRFFTDPTLTFNFASLGVPGLKVAFAASLYTYNSYPNSTLAGDNAFYGNATSGAGAQAKALGSSITPSVSYSMGPFAATLGLKYSNYDDSVSNPAGKDPTFDPSLKLAYTLSF